MELWFLLLLLAAIIVSFLFAFWVQRDVNSFLDSQVWVLGDRYRDYIYTKRLRLLKFLYAICIALLSITFIWLFL